MRTLTLPMKAEYFDQIKSGWKKEEFRLDTSYWEKRLFNPEYDRIVLTRGYPKRGDQSRRIERPWRGVNRKKIIHQHFGPEPVTVWAIKVN